MLLKNEKISLQVDEHGTVEKLVFNEDSYKMNWVIDKDYLKQVGYTSQDKLFGHFELKFEDKLFQSVTMVPTIFQQEQSCQIIYELNGLDVVMNYDLSQPNRLVWQIAVHNKTSLPMKLQHFSVWSSFAYMMFRDKNVQRNIFQSAAVFPTISPDFTKLAVMRRSGKASSLGIFQTKGQTLSLGSYCEFENKFFEAVSPSLDGVIYHSLVLSDKEKAVADWVYPNQQIVIPPGNTVEWEYVIMEVQDQADFYEKGSQLGHPVYQYADLALVDQQFELVYQSNSPLEKVNIYQAGTLLENHRISIQKSKIQTSFQLPGEHKIVLYFEDGTQDQLIINVMSELKELIQDRVTYLCEQSYQESAGDQQDVFLPVSNQGESLGKMSLVLKKNLLGQTDQVQIEKVERSLNHYVLNKWFEQGDFTKPKKLYGEFYRVMDFEYLGHLLYLLAQVPNDYLQLNDAKTYLLWAAQVVELRINPDLHTGFREKEESEMLGVFFLYIDDLLAELERTLPEHHAKLSLLWENNLFKILEEKNDYAAAMTEHFYDNAGFGPAAASLANAHYTQECRLYGDLLLANIGFSNDFRMQNPDRWWEALSYMIHSLWGGISAAAALDVFHETKDPRYLEASYRAFIAVLYCYDTNASNTTKLAKGAAASTFACAKPHYNREDLAHARFGQETFAGDGGIFSSIFSEESQQTSDWDMGEELVAFLDRFGQDAYCYESAGQIKCINCHIQTDSQSYLVNDAPYPRNLYVLTKGELKVVDNYVPLTQLFQVNV
ncbi:hypothetical protein RU97_GL001480 [Enterococcus canis]|uniref:Uncharacterized protein n=1 Tax=Enterococcus canis TaxID=214095 RepID=A0A1L8RGP5_9ENTE|nr:hypothetical protein [Enterococcus canis]OJG18862.1 hypothetical protein RU97_GL001480 [Enterococcus canis]